VFGKESLDRDTRDHLADQRQLAAPPTTTPCSRALVEYAKRGQATIVTPFLLMGAMSPVSVPATLAQQVGEALAGIALVQDDPPGCPVVFGSFLSEHRHAVGLAELRHSRVGRSACSAPAQNRAPLHLPFRGGGGADVVAGRRRRRRATSRLMSLWQTFLAGYELRHALGRWLESALVSCYEKFVTERGAPADDVPRVPAARDQRRRRSPSPRTRRWGGAATSSAPYTRSSASASASTGRSVSSTENYERWNRNGGPRHRDAGRTRSGRRPSRSTRSRRSMAT